MADAWPQIERCKLAQWRGLTERQQDMISKIWDDGYVPGLFTGVDDEILIWGAVPRDGEPPIPLITLKSEKLGIDPELLL